MINKEEYPSITRGRVVLWGLLAAYPFGGMVWQVLHHLVGLRRLGYDVWYVEDSDGAILNPNTWEFLLGPDADYTATISQISHYMDEIGLSDRWVFRPPGVNDVCYGASDISGLDKLYREVDAVLNLCGSHKLLERHGDIKKLVYIQTDPVEQQIAIANGNQGVIDELDSYDFLFTYGENFGARDCGVPIERYDWIPTRPPICIDFWESSMHWMPKKFTTVGNWLNHKKGIVWQGETYHWQKAPEFQKVIDLPSRAKVPIELALVGIKEQDQSVMREHGWKIISAITLSDPMLYRNYIQDSLGEFSVAKDQNIRLRSGWFSDRSACYLASGRPVVTQDTGFGNILPTGAGLFSFSDEDQAVYVVKEILDNYDYHSIKAKEVAIEYFSYEKVLGKIVEKADIF